MFLLLSTNVLLLRPRDGAVSPVTSRAGLNAGLDRHTLGSKRYPTKMPLRCRVVAGLSFPGNSCISSSQAIAEPAG